MRTASVAIGVGGGGITDMLAWPDTPSLTALTTAVPGAIPDTMPESVTLATEVLELNHDIARPESAFPSASFAVAVARAVWPAISESGTFIETDATFGGAGFLTSTAEVPYDEHAARL